MNIILRNIFCKIILLSIFYPIDTFSQEKKLIEIIEAGKFSRDEENFPKANILSKGNNFRVKLYHDGATIISDKTFFYSKESLQVNVLFCMIFCSILLMVELL